MESFIARQPIFDRGKNVVAYELLFRGGFENIFDCVDGTAATNQVMVDSLMLFGVRSLTGGKKAFVNVTRDVLVNDVVQMFPKDLIVPEILENIKEEEAVVAACLRLKKAGYEIALDDICASKEREQFESFADFVKIDFRNTDEAAQRRLAQYYRDMGVRIIAEKVETPGEFKRAVEMGYEFFQGYFFARPEVLSKKGVPGDKLRYMQLVRQINQSELDIQQIESLIKQDVSLSYRLLKYINSAFFGWRVEIRSIRQALVLLGENEIKRWATLVSVTFMGDEKPPALLVTALTRARFCEFLAPQVGMRRDAQDLFLMGLFSLLDAVMDRPLDEILGEVPISPSIVSALLGDESEYRAVLDMAICYEKGDWARFSKIAARLGAREDVVPEAYINAVGWAAQSFEATLSVVPGSVAPPKVF